MYYEFYADEFFIVNFLTDCWICMILKVLTHCPATRWKIILVSALESLFATILICVQMPWQLKMILIHMLINPAGILLLYTKKNTTKKITAYLYTYIIAAVLGGIFQAIKSIIDLNLISMSIILVFSYMVIVVISQKNKAEIYKEKKYVDVKITVKGNEIDVKGLIDTGNSLVEPITKKPVSVIEYEAVKQIEDKMMKEGVYIIPYKSVGKENGMLIGIRIDRMTINCDKEEYIIEKPIIAISQESVSAKEEYKIIINPLLVN